MAQARTLTDREFHKLLEVVSQFRHGKRSQLMLQMTHWAGFRVGELAELKVTDLLDGDGQVKEQVLLQSHQTKGSKARVVFLPAKLRGCVADYMKGQGGDGWLFTSQKREKFSANTLQATMTGLYERAGFTDCTSHTGRRSFLTKLATQGVTARVLQELAGHKNLATTQRYIDVNDDMKRSALLLI